jgi:O-antigen/teichoic acid export membrane protein
MKKKFLFDITLNVISSALPILVLQLLVLPLIAKQVGQDDYGLIISLVSVAYILSQPFGSVMNNLRLLKHEEYKKENIRGDFNYIIIRLIILNLVFVIFATIIVSPVFSILNIVLMIVFSTLFLLQNYYIVEYRIHLNFWKILLLNILLVIGYVIGLAFFLKGLSWQVIYIVGLLFVLVFLFFKGNLIREPINKTKKFKETRKDFGILFGSVFLKSSIQHIDKIILLFLLGTSYVSIYYTATFPSKAIALLITPISMVMLSY